MSSSPLPYNTVTPINHDAEGRGILSLPSHQEMAQHLF